MCPTAFLAPTLTAKTCFICIQPQNAFFLAQLALQGNRANGPKSRYLVEFPAQKKEPKWFQNLGRFKKNSSFLLSGQKKSPKNWTGPCLSLNMVRRKRFIKWQTPSRNAKSSFEGANPTPPSPMQQWRPPARTTIVSRTVGGLGSEGDKTVIPGPKYWNPISSSKWILLARHGLNHCRPQCHIRMAAEIDVVIFEWQQEGVGKQRLSNSCLKTGLGKQRLSNSYLKTGAGKAEVEQ